MGGDALGFPVARLWPERYAAVVATITAALRGVYFTRCEATIPRPAKASFGDVDLLVSHPLQPLDVRRLFASSAVAVNGPVLSFEYEGHQVDLIDVGEGSFDMARFTYSYGDMGMTLGMVAVRVGLKLGYQGLSVVLDSHRLKLSSELPAILGFLGLDLERWERGFVTDGEVFAFIASSRFFRPSMFLRSVQRGNQGERKAAVKRGMFADFLQYVQAHYAEEGGEVGEEREEKLQCSEESDYCDEWPSAEEVQEEAVRFFGKEREAAEKRQALDRARLIKERWNGRVVAEKTGLQGKELAGFMAHCRRQVRDEALAAMTAEEVGQLIAGEWRRRAPAAAS